MSVLVRLYPIDRSLSSVDYRWLNVQERLNRGRYKGHRGRAPKRKPRTSSEKRVCEELIAVILLLRSDLHPRKGGI